MEINNQKIHLYEDETTKEKAEQILNLLKGQQISAAKTILAQVEIQIDNYSIVT
jgi:hypothetical protein